jgi:hypothetical protein
MPLSKSWIWLRIAAIITLLYCAGHTMGVPWTPATGPAEQAVIAAMKTARFDAMGATRTYWDFYLGFGVIVSLYLLVQACVLWQLAAIERRSPGTTRPIAAAFCIAFIANAVIAQQYFFIIPLIMSLMIATCLAVAFYVSPHGAVDPN